MKAIFGYGSPRFTLGNLSANFGAHHGAGRVTFEQSLHEFTTLSGKYIESFHGWRAVVTFHLYNVKNLDYEPHLRLINIINQSKITGHPIICQPRFDVPINLSLPLVFKSSFGFEEITNLNAGQTIDLEFRSQELFDSIPGFVNLPSYLLLGEEYLGLGSGDRLVLPEIDSSYYDGSGANSTI